MSNFLMSDKKKFSDLLLIFLLAVLLRVPAFFEERIPYLFCDEYIFPGEALRMFNEGTFITNEFRAGAINSLSILPFLHVANLLGITPDPVNVVLIGRMVQTLLIGGLTSIFLYLTGLKLFSRRIFGILSALVFIISPSVYAYSRFAYPDHYVYFFSAGVLYFLTRYLQGERSNFVLSSAIVLGALGFSVKYSGLFLAVPIIVAMFIGANTDGRGVNRTRNFGVDLLKLFGLGSITLLIVNYSAVANPRLFMDGLMYNSNNYANFPGTFSGAFSYYFFSAYVISFSFLGVLLISIGHLYVYQKFRSFFWVLISFPLSLMTYLSTLGLVLNRNVSILIPFIVISITAGIKFVTEDFSKKKISLRVSILSLLVVSTVVCLIQLTHSVNRDLKQDSRILAQRWISENVEKSTTIGTNEFCSGVSPADNAGFTTVLDGNFEQKLPVYVLNSYWHSPLSPYYQNSIPFWLQFDQKYIHFYHFNDREILRLPKIGRNIIDYIPSGYRLEEFISSNGPDIVIVVRTD